MKRYRGKVTGKERRGRRVNLKQSAVPKFVLLQLACSLTGWVTRTYKPQRVNVQLNSR